MNECDYIILLGPLIIIGVLIAMVVDTLIDRYRDRYALKHGRWPS